MNLSQEDKLLLDGLHAKEKAAFATIYSRFHKYAFRVAFKMTGLQEESEDLASESLLRLWAKLGSVRFDKLNGVKSYLAMTVRNAVLDARKKAITRPIPDNFHYPAPIELPFSSPKVRQTLLQTLISKSPFDDQEIAMLHLLDQEKDMRTIAHCLQISYSTAHRKKNEILNKLKLRFKQVSNKPGSQYIEINYSSH